MRQLNEGGDFKDLARKYSIDLPGALEGGGMGIVEKGNILPQLEKVLFSLQEGEYSDIVKSKYGYHILRVDEFISLKYKPYEEVREEIIKIMIRQKESEAFDQMATELEKNYDIQIYEDRL
jgi:peptidyl-prolyl cis-trans isomerase C